MKVEISQARMKPIADLLFEMRLTQAEALALGLRILEMVLEKADERQVGDALRSALGNHFDPEIPTMMSLGKLH